jgi:1-deoxy-D-xylulose-5-phosphate synthase
VYFHTPPAFEQQGDRPIPKKIGSTPAYTNLMSEAIRVAMSNNPRVTVLTAAMCQGNKLECVRDEFPQRFFDAGICESHAVAFAAGQAKAGLRPVVDIYSTFLQRSFDQIFQEVCLQNLPVVFAMDRAGLTGPDGPTHHGCFDIGYMRIFPNLVCMAPGDETDVVPMLDFDLQHDAPSSIRYPKANAERVGGQRTPLELGKAEVLSWGRDGMFLCFGTLLADCLRAAQKLRDDDGLEVGVVNMRFVKPIDVEVITRAIRESQFVITVEEGQLMGGFGSAVLEAANEAGLETQRIHRLGIPDRFVEHGERSELLADLGLDQTGFVKVCRELAERYCHHP